MRDLSHTGVLVCALALLLLALPAQAAPRERAHAASPAASVAAWLDSVWNELTRPFIAGIRQPAAKARTTQDGTGGSGGFHTLLDSDHGGSCIDPDGAGLCG